MLGYGDYASFGSPIMHAPVVDAFKKESRREPNAGGPQTHGPQQADCWWREKSPE